MSGETILTQTPTPSASPTPEVSYSGYIASVALMAVVVIIIGIIRGIHTIRRFKRELEAYDGKLEDFLDEDDGVDLGDRMDNQNKINLDVSD